MEIKVVVPDAFAASDLTWYLTESASVGVSDDGIYTVHVQAGENIRRVLAEIRVWLRLHHVASVVVHVADERSTLTPDLEAGV